MSEEKKERLSFREALACSRRGIGIWLKYCPEALTIRGVKHGVEALAPYLPLYFTARLVNAITGGGDAGEIWRMLAALLISTAAVGAVRAGMEYWFMSVLESRQWPAFNRIFFDKLLSMDFCDVDDPKTQTLLTQIMQNNNWSFWGLQRLPEAFGDLVGAVFRITGAVALSVSLFTMPVKSDSPLAWLNSPWCLAGMAVLMVAAVLISSVLDNKGNDYWASYDGTQSNRGFSYFLFVAMRERQRGTDIRVYTQDRYFEAEGRKICVSDDGGGFSPRSTIGRAAQGPMGACFAGAQGISQAFTGVIYLFAGLEEQNKGRAPQVIKSVGRIFFVPERCQQFPVYT